MNPRSLLLAGSLMGNLVLLGAIAWGLRSPPEVITPPPPRLEPPQPAAPAIGPELWASLRPDELPTLVTRLRVEGFPPALIGAIVAGEVHEQFAARRKALTQADSDKPYWRTSSYDFIPSPAVQALYREEAALTRSLLRPEEDLRQMSETDALRRQFPQLPTEKISALLKIDEEFNDRQNEIMAASGGWFGPSLPGADEKISALKRARLERLAGVLTPQEMDDYNLRASDTANSLRDNLAAFAPTEGEFRALFRLREEFDRKFGSDWSHLSQAEQRARWEAEEKLTEAIKATLGEARFAEYERASDLEFRLTSELVSRLGQPAAVASQVWTLQSDLKQRRSQILTDRSLAPEQRSAQFAALAEETKSKLTAALGERGYEAYRQNGCGAWLQSIENGR